MGCHLKFEENFAEYTLELFKISDEKRAEVGSVLHMENSVVSIADYYVVGNLYQIPVEELFLETAKENKLDELFGYIHTHIVKPVPFPGADDLGVGLLAGLALGKDEFYCATVVGRMPDHTLTLITDCIETIRSTFPVYFERVKTTLEKLYSLMQADRKEFVPEYTRKHFFAELVIAGHVGAYTEDLANMIIKYAQQLDLILEDLQNAITEYIRSNIDKSKPWAGLGDFYKKNCVIIYFKDETFIGTTSEWKLRFE
jgi:hypothetical protein